MKKISTKNISNPLISDFLSSSQWIELNSYNKKLDLSFFEKSEFDKDINQIEKKMFELLYDDSWMGHCAKYQLESGGKRFRVILALIASKMFGLSKDISRSIAICCEFIHNASLIHDDLQDRDLLRRGLPTIWNRFGDHTAINLGDFFIASSYDVLSKTKSIPELKCKAIEELGKTIKQTVKGQSVEILSRSDFHLKIQDYETTSRAKTGGLISLPIKLASIFSGHNKDDDYYKPFYETGVAYQIQDDLSDFLGIKDRGLPGRDLKEGKMNVLIMHYIDSASEGEKFILQKFLKKRYDSISEDEISFWMSKIKNKGALEKSLKYLFDVSKRSIEQASKSNNDLQNIVQFVIKSIITRITKKIKEK